MNFCKQSAQRPNSPEAYQTLLADAIRGDQSAFVRFDEIEASWKIIDRALKKPRVLYAYKKRSSGPNELVEWSKKYGLEWKA